MDVIYPLHVLCSGSPYHPLPICIYMRRTNIFWATLPMTLCFVIVISVNIYVIKVILAQKSSVAPTVTLPPAPSTDQLELEAGQGEGRTIQKIQRMDEDPSMFYKADMQAMCDTLFTPC